MNRCKNDKADETRMIRFIDPNYREMFQIPDGAYVEVKYPNSTVIVACRYMDEYHLRFGSEVYHWMRGRMWTTSKKTRSPSCWIYLRIACVKCITVLIA